MRNLNRLLTCRLGDGFARYEVPSMVMEPSVSIQTLSTRSSTSCWLFSDRVFSGQLGNIIHVPIKNPAKQRAGRIGAYVTASRYDSDVPSG